MAPKVPAGFKIELVASGIAGPRVIRTAPNGDIFVANSMANEVLLLRPGEGGAKPFERSVFAKGLFKPYGIAFYPPGPDPEWIYVANTDSVVRFPYRNGDMTADRQAGARSSSIFPSTHHWTRDIAFSPDGKTMFLSVGSGSNVALDMGKAPPAASSVGRRASRSAPPGTRRRSAPTSSPSIADGQGRAHRRDRACATAPA